MLRNDKNGQYQRGGNGEKICEVRLQDDNTKFMTKDEMYRFIDTEGKKLIFQGGVYYMVDQSPNGHITVSSNVSVFQYIFIGTIPLIQSTLLQKVGSVQ